MKKLPGKLLEAVCWIALEDSPGNGDSEKVISEYVTTALVADVFDTTTTNVARLVATARKARGIAVPDSEGMQ